MSFRDGGYAMAITTVIDEDNALTVKTIDKAGFDRVIFNQGLRRFRCTFGRKEVLSVISLNDNGVVGTVFMQSLLRPRTQYIRFKMVFQVKKRTLFRMKALSTWIVISMRKYRRGFLHGERVVLAELTVLTTRKLCAGAGMVVATEPLCLDSEEEQV